MMISSCPPIIEEIPKPSTYLLFSKDKKEQLAVIVGGKVTFKSDPKKAF